MKAVVVIALVPEARGRNRKVIEAEIRNSINCDWLLKVKNITILDETHHRMPNGKEIECYEL